MLFPLPEENGGCGSPLPHLLWARVGLPPITPAPRQAAGSLALRGDPQRVSSAARFILPVAGGWLYSLLEHDPDPDLCQDAVPLPVVSEAWPDLCLVAQAKSAVSLRLVLIPSLPPCCVSREREAVLGRGAAAGARAVAVSSVWAPGGPGPPP